MAARNLKTFYLGLILTFFFFIPSLMADTASQVFDKSPLNHEWRKGELRSAPAQGDVSSLAAAAYTNPRVFQDIDALNYTIDIHFNPGADPYPNNAYITATSTIRAKAKASILTQVVIDFYDNITINSFLFKGAEFTNYTRADNKIWMNLTADPLMPGEEFEITLDYSCVIGGEWQGVLFRRHSSTGPSNPNGAQIYYSMNQPYYSPGWYPCFDYPGDKVTADIYITCPDWMIVVANGLSQPGYPIDNGDGTKTHYWKEKYQIYTSVLAVNMSNYVTWSDTYISPLDGTTMPLTYYVFPEDETNARATFGINNVAMVFYAQKFGEYPFIEEKYGIAEVANPFGSMEHQTITALTYRSTRSPINWDVQVHELAHMWWGDWVTCDTWNHVWLDEGMATYAEILFHENYTGEPAGPFMAINYDDGLYAGNLAGTVYAENLAEPWDDQGAIYDKAGWVIHMLRHMLGDAQFFAAVKAYGQAHGESTAVTDDLRTVMEDHYGQSLVDFFNQWIYTPYRPVYSIIYEKSGSAGNYTININLSQTQSHMVQDLSGTPLRDFYIMPVDFTVHYTDSTSETFTFQNIQKNQNFEIITSKEPDHVVFDEGINILKIKSETMVITTTTVQPTSTTTTSAQPTTSTTVPPTTTTTVPPASQCADQYASGEPYIFYTGSNQNCPFVDWGLVNYFHHTIPFPNENVEYYATVHFNGASGCIDLRVVIENNYGAAQYFNNVTNGQQITIIVPKSYFDNTNFDGCSSNWFVHTADLGWQFQQCGGGWLGSSIISSPKPGCNLNINTCCPGESCCTPTAITLSSFTAEPGNGSVTLNWTTESEINNAGFNLYRSEARHGRYLKINGELISAKGTSTGGATYEYTDAGLKNRKTYFYKLEDIDLTGTSTFHGPVKVSQRLISGKLRHTMK